MSMDDGMSGCAMPGGGLMESSAAASLNPVVDISVNASVWAEDEDEDEVELDCRSLSILSLGADRYHQERNMVRCMLARRLARAQNGRGCLWIDLLLSSS